MRNPNRKRKPKHMTKSKYKVIFGRESMWVVYRVKSTKKTSVKSFHSEKMLRTKRYKKVYITIRKKLFMFRDYKPKYDNKYINRIK